MVNRCLCLMFDWDRIGPAGLVACRGQEMGQEMGLTSCVDASQILGVVTTGS